MKANNREDWIAQADGRQTDEDLMGKIWTLAGWKYEKANRIWNDPTGFERRWLASQVDPSRSCWGNQYGWGDE